MKVKRLLAMVLCMCIAFSCGTSTSAASAIEVVDHPRVETMTEEECADFLERMGVEIPQEIIDGFGEDYFHLLDIRGLVIGLNENPLYGSMINNTPMHTLIQDIRAALAKYQTESPFTSVYALSANQLEESVFWSWASNMTNYNSDIAVISYRSEHQGATYTGQNYHQGNLHCFLFSGTCECGKKFGWESYPCSGNPCIIPYTIPPEPEIS